MALIYNIDRFDRLWCNHGRHQRGTHDHSLTLTAEIWYQGQLFTASHYSRKDGTVRHRWRRRRFTARSLIWPELARHVPNDDAHKRQRLSWIVHCYPSFIATSLTESSTSYSRIISPFILRHVLLTRLYELGLWISSPPLVLIYVRFRVGCDLRNWDLCTW
jgi:hypothetical protein